MKVVVFRECEGKGNGNGWLQFALSDRRLWNIVYESHSRKDGRSVLFAVPQHWQTASGNGGALIVRYGRTGINLQLEKGDTADELLSKNEAKWLMISDGAVLCKAGLKRLKPYAEDLRADAACVTFEPSLSGYHERMCVTKDNEIVGWRRYYGDRVELCRTPEDWPHRILIRAAAFRKIWLNKVLTGDFDEFLSACSANSLKLISLKAAGHPIDIRSWQGILSAVRFASRATASFAIPQPEVLGDNARLIGPVIVGEGVHIGRDAVVVGPAVLADGVRIGDGAIVKNAIVAPRTQVPARAVIRDCGLKEDGLAQDGAAEPSSHMRVFPEESGFERDYFRTWRPWSYPRYIKRLFDVAASAGILLLFLPFFPVIALAIKLSSPGPVFYRARRQGLGGKEFDCLKFRTMVQTAEGLQEKLRAVNQVDGPQFKMDNDPRVNAVGQFLRDTNIDEIPQFINVLRGQMSVIGPRPSPEHENTGCPQWRYARLSVRPGITGLWQLKRTRGEGRDFQEWVHYDCTYVRTLSFKTDFMIFWKTAQKLINDFVDQF